MTRYSVGVRKGAVRREQIARRDALRIWVWQHLNKFPDTWFGEVDLARVIREQYACEPKTPSLGCHYGRSTTIADVLRYLEERGEAVMRTGQCANGGRRTRREWQAAP